MSLAYQPDLFTGRQLRGQGMALADDAEGQHWKDEADRAIARYAKSCIPFTAESIREFAGNPDHPNAFGPAIQRAIRAGLIERVGYQQAERPSARARVLAVYRGVSS